MVGATSSSFNTHTHARIHARRLFSSWSGLIHIIAVKISLVPIVVHRYFFLEQNVIFSQFLIEHGSKFLHHCLWVKVLRPAT